MNGGYHVVGTCSLCGGAVSLYVGPWHGINPPVPTCMNCKAVKQESLPVIPMRPMIPMYPSKPSDVPFSPSPSKPVVLPWPDDDLPPSDHFFYD